MLKQWQTVLRFALCARLGQPEIGTPGFLHCGKHLTMEYFV